MRPALVATMACAGCLFGGGSGQPQQPPADVVIAVGARVLLELYDCSVSLQTATICVGFRPEDVTSVTTTGNAFTIGPYTPDGILEGTVEVQALHEGDSEIVVAYKDLVYGPKTQRIRLRAARVTDTQVKVSCENGSSTEPFPVIAGAAVKFRAQAFSGPLEVVSGDLELVTAPGFALSAPVDDADRMATASLQPGPYTWTLMGGRTVRFIIFDAATLGLAVTSTRDVTTGVTTVTAQTALANTPVCTGGAGLGFVEVTQGGCLPSIAGVEIAGPMPVDLKSPVTFNLAAAAPASCTVAVYLDGGLPYTATFDAAPSSGGPTVAVGDPIPAAGLTIAPTPPAVGTCGASLSDGDCDGIIDDYPLPPLDGDCYLDSEWSIEQRDGTGRNDDLIGDKDLIGVGLATELRMLIHGEFLGQDFITIGPPINPKYTLLPDGAVALEDLGCSTTERNKVVRVTPLASGSTQLLLRADNLDDVAWVTIQASAIDRMVVAGLPQRSAYAGATAWADCFVGSELSLGVTYEASDGTALRGVAPITVSSDSPTATTKTVGAFIHYSTLYTGSTPGSTITIAAPAAKQSQVIQVVDASAITGISGLGNATVTSNPELCASFTPTSSRGAICGVPPSGPRLTVTGKAFGVRQGSFGSLCLSGISAGKSTLSVTWGAVTSQATWEYAPTKTP